MIPVAKPLLGSAEAEAAAAVINSGWVAQGPRVASFEEAVAAQVGARYGVAVSSCTAALHLGLLALGVGAGDEVIVPSLSFIASTNAVRYTGATPVFADVDLITQALTPETIAPCLSQRTRAVMVVHQAGVPADLDAIRDLLEPRGVPLIEDAACAMGSTYKGTPIGSHSNLAAFSFHPRKVITTGEGGMVTTDSQGEARLLRRLREHGMSVSAADRHASGSVAAETYEELGFNYRMTDIQAAIGLVQLERLPSIVARRRQIAAVYRRRLAEMEGLVMAGDPPWGTTNYQSFWVLLPQDYPLSRDQLLERYRKAGISPRRGIMAAHLEPACAGIQHGPLPVSERLTHDSLILPLHHELTDADIDSIVCLLMTGVAGA